MAGSYEIDFRIIVENQVRWISARGQGADADIVGRLMFGIFLDVTGRKQAEEGNELLAGEMSHRVKNLLAIASSLTTLTSRSARSIEEMTSALTTRLMALGRAHDLVRPIPGSQGSATLLGDLISVLLDPYDDHDAFSGRIRVTKLEPSGSKPQKRAKAKIDACGIGSQETRPPRSERRRAPIGAI